MALDSKASFNLDDHISKTPGFPKPGITFYDIIPALDQADMVADGIIDDNENIAFKKVDSKELQEFQRVMRLFEEEE